MCSLLPAQANEASQPEPALRIQQADVQFAKLWKPMPTWLKVLIWTFSLVPVIVTIPSVGLLWYLGGNPWWVIGAGIGVLVVWVVHLSLQLWQKKPEYWKLRAKALAAQHKARKSSGGYEEASFEAVVDNLRERSNHPEYGEDFKQYAGIMLRNKYTMWYILFADVAGASLKAT